MLDQFSDPALPPQGGRGSGGTEWFWGVLGVRFFDKAVLCLVSNAQINIKTELHA